MKKQILSFIFCLTLFLGLSVPAVAYEMSKQGQASTASSSFSGHTGVVDVNGSLWMCGSNSAGQLGDGTKNRSLTFIKVMDDVKSVSCGKEFTAAVKSDGSLWMWGSNYNGALTGDDPEAVLTPKKIMDGVISVSCGEKFTAALKVDGSLWVWGSGCLGNGIEPSQKVTTPVQIMTDVVAVSSGGIRSAAIKTDGSLWTWGKLETLGLDCQLTPVKTMDDVIAVSCGYWNTAAIKTDGSLWIWGSNDGGQLADGELHTFGSSLTPRKVMDNVTSVSCGGSQIAAVTADGTLWTWGGNDCGELGNGRTGTNYLSDGTPIQLKPGIIANNVAFAICGNLNTFIIKTDGSVWGCGRSLYIGGISNGTDMYGYPMQTVPVQMPGVTAKLSSPATIVSKVGGFNDVFETDYCADAVLWAVEKGITAGTTSTTFVPAAACTKAQILTFLWRSQGKPEPSIQNPFSDISEDNYYYKAALWASEKGLVSGPTFGGDTPCTRAATMTYLWKLAGGPAASPAAFTDVPTSADYAQAVAWAVSKGITGGISATTFSPSNVCTRGQIVTFLYRAFA